MKFKHLSIMVTKLRLLLRLHYSGTSQRQISIQLDLSRTSIKSYSTRLLESGKNQEELEQQDDSTLLFLARGEPYKQTPDKRYESLKPLLASYAEESNRPYVTFLLLWEEYLQKLSGQMRVV